MAEWEKIMCEINICLETWNCYKEVLSAQNLPVSFVTDDERFNSEGRLGNFQLWNENKLECFQDWKRIQTFENVKEKM